jgi:hypothetical protein
LSISEARHISFQAKCAKTQTPRAKFLLKKKKGSPFEKEESALRVSIDMVPERAASHMPASKPFESAHPDLGARSPEELFQKFMTGVPTSQQNRPTWSGVFNLAQDAASTLKSPVTQQRAGNPLGRVDSERPLPSSTDAGL